MIYHSDMYNKQEFLNKGREVELKLLSQLKNCIESNDNEDINQHIDLKQIIGVDVKGLKKINREDDEPNEHFHWVEFKNVNGDNGWLYGDADFFAFETIDYFFIVERMKLKQFVESKCKLKIWCPSPALYELYRREGRNEVLTLIKTIDIAALSEKIIFKNQ